MCLSKKCIQHEHTANSRGNYWTILHKKYTTADCILQQRLVRGAGYIAGCVRKKGHRYQIAAQRGGRQFARNCGKYIFKMCIKNNEFWIIILTIKICIKLCTVWKVLTDFAVYDWWHYGKALCDEKFSKIEGNGRIFSHSVTTRETECARYVYWLYC